MRALRFTIVSCLLLGGCAAPIAQALLAPSASSAASASVAPPVGAPSPAADCAGGTGCGATAMAAQIAQSAGGSLQQLGGLMAAGRPAGQ